MRDNWLQQEALTMGLTYGLPTVPADHVENSPEKNPEIERKRPIVDIAAIKPDYFLKIANHLIPAQLP
jgi:hypothetical protein